MFQGVRKRDKALITVKEVQIEDIAQNQRVVSIRKEIEALKVVQHANILRYLGTSVEGDKLQVMQEWAETCSLKVLLLESNNNCSLLKLDYIVGFRSDE